MHYEDQDVLDEVYMICCPAIEGGGIIYAAPAKTAKEAWQNALKATRDITGWGREYLTKKGYRAKRVVIIL
jgi:hypothetical protein